MKIPTLIAVAAIAFPVLAPGQTSIVQTINFDGVPDFSAPLVFSKYNGSLANLTDVRVDFNLTIEGGQFVVDNDSPTPATTTVNFGASLSAGSGDVLLLNNSFNPILDNVSAINSQTFSLAPDNGDGLNNYDSAGPDGGVLVGTPKSASGGDSVNPLFWSQYVGPGTFTITASSSQIGSLSYNSGIETATTPVTAKGSITVTYSVIPEPSALGLAALSALGLAFRRRRA